MRRSDLTPKAKRLLKERLAKLHNGNECYYCGIQLPLRLLTIDHICPVSLGGKTTIGNTVLACQPCNSVKGNQLGGLEHFKEKLRDRKAALIQDKTVKSKKGSLSNKPIIPKIQAPKELVIIARAPEVKKKQNIIKRFLNWLWKK